MVKSPSNHHLTTILSILSSMAIHHGSHGTPPLPLKLRKARSTPMEAPPVVIRQLASTGAPYCCDRKPPKRGFLAF